MKTFIYVLFFFHAITAFAATPEWTISCLQTDTNTNMTIELYRTGHPMGGLYSYSGLVFHNNNIFMTDFINVEPPILKGQAKDLDNTDYSIVLTSEVLNTNEEMPVTVETSYRPPLSDEVKETLYFTCRGR